MPVLPLGEWQTQLSRPQLRALRQKQRTDEHKESQEAKNSVATEGNSNSELEVSSEVLPCTWSVFCVGNYVH